LSDRHQIRVRAVDQGGELLIRRQAHPHVDAELHQVRREGHHRLDVSARPE